MATARGAARRPVAADPPPVPRRLTLRRPRTTLNVVGSYNVGSHVDLVADEALDDLAAPRAALLNTLIPRMGSLNVLTTPGGGVESSVIKFVVTAGKAGESNGQPPLHTRLHQHTLTWMQSIMYDTHTRAHPARDAHSPRRALSHAAASDARVFGPLCADQPWW